MRGGRRQCTTVTQEQFDDAARAIYQHVTGRKAGGREFLTLENDRWFVLARIALEGAGLNVP